MIQRVTEALASRREAMRASDKGFTLIELLVVVLIIGVLAAIAVPVYLGVQNSANDASAKSDLVNAKIAAVAYFTANPSGAALTAATAATTLDDFGATNLVATAAAGKATGTASAANVFCFAETSKSGTSFKIASTAASADAEPVSGTC